MKTLLFTLSLIVVSQLSFAQNCSQKLTVMDELSVNGDGVNDDFFVEFECPVDDFHIIIYNPRGNKVFESKDPSFKWNCMDENGKLVDAGALMFKLKYMYEGDEFSEKGKFTLIY